MSLPFRSVLCGAALVLWCATAHAATATYEILLDLDRNAATGCAVATTKGTVSGIEEAVVTTVTTTPTGASVTGVARRTCTAGVLGAPVGYSGGGWAVGLGKGSNGSAVVETFIAQSALGGATGPKVALTATGGGGSDSIIAAAGGSLPEITLAALPTDTGSIAIPALGPIALGLLSALLALLALRAAGRRRETLVVLLAAGLAASAGLVWAATVLLDGQIGDWSGVAPLATDAKGNAPKNADVVALFAQHDASNVYFRIDADVVPDVSDAPVNLAPNVNAGADQTITLPASANLGGSGSDDGLPDPPALLAFAWSKVSGPGNVTFGNPNAPTTSAGFSASGTYVLRLTANDGALSQSDDVRITVNPAPVQGLLGGDPGARAIANLPNVDGPTVAPADIVLHRLLTRLFVVLEPDITVGQFNAAVDAVGATAIATSRTGSRFLTLTVPRQANLAALNERARTLDEQPGIDFADAGMEGVTSVLPDFAVPGGAQTQFDHLLATRLPLAWNAQGRIADCLPRIVPVIVFDKFGQQSLRPSFAGQMNPGNFVAGARQVELDPLDAEAGHGYDVSLVLAAKYDSIAPIGAYPFADCIEIRQLENSGLDMSEALLRLAAMARQLTDSRFVINASNNFPDPLCGANSNLACSDETLAQTTPDSRGVALIGRVERALHWVELAAAPGAKFIDRALITVAAGNKDSASPGFLLVNAYPGFGDANWSSPFALATQLQSVGVQATDPALWNSTVSNTHPSFTLSAADAQRLQARLGLAALGSGLEDVIFNTLTVGSASSGPVRTAVTRSAFGFDNARVLAGGEDVIVDSGGDKDSGTSMAAPQIAGLAAMLWAHSDDLRNRSPGETAQLIRSTATVLPSGGQSLPVRLVDAYQAVLSLDDPGSSMAIRRALLDLNDDGVFDDSDLAIFQTQYGLFPGVQLTGGNIPAFGRYDLNGDGYTAGPRRDRFDLDVTGNSLLAAPQFGTATQTIEGQEVRFDETSVTDTDVLCYYAYSSLYTGTPEFRREVLGLPRCLAFKLETTFPTSLPGGAATTMVVHATQLESNSGQMVDAGNVHVSVTVLEGATVTPAFGATALDGTFGFVVQPKAGATTIRLIVEARRQAGDPVLASAVVTASVGAVPTGVIVSPGAAAVGFGRSRSFTALTGTPPISWSATGGTITQSGFYTAGFVEGQYFVFAGSANGGGGFATVIVDRIVGIYRGAWRRSGSSQLFDRQVTVSRFLSPQSGCAFGQLACYAIDGVDFGTLGEVGPCNFQPVPGAPDTFRGPCGNVQGGSFEATIPGNAGSLVGTIRNDFGQVIWSFDLTRQ